MGINQPTNFFDSYYEYLQWQNNSQKSISFPSIFDGLFFSICFGGDNLQAEMQGEEVPAAAAESSLESHQMERDFFVGQCVYIYIYIYMFIYIQS